MLRVTLWLLVGVFVCASCAITCPDGSVCSDSTTCCLTKNGYSCCHYPNEPVNKQVPDQIKSSVVHCDNYYVCPDSTTCCRHPTGVWFCCPYSPGWCCRDGYHCCAWGYDCDVTYTHCVRRQGLRYPFIPDQSKPSVPASLILPSEEKSSLQETPMTALAEASDINTAEGVIRCDPRFYCSAGTSCCKASTGKWSCCPFKLGQCCADGRHCCAYGFKCDSTSTSCKGQYSEIPSLAQDAKTV
ncbi:progranulin-like isoform X2 [Anarhichas minor]|uniref:progranulin-like isoform X2 n=1 Tax=Anarhichas minor TaxID=65739 RepID=UPI003F731E43